MEAASLKQIMTSNAAKTERGGERRKTEGEEREKERSRGADALGGARTGQHVPGVLRNGTLDTYVI